MSRIGDRGQDSGLTCIIKDMGIAIAAARAQGPGSSDHSALLKMTEAFNGGLGSDGGAAHGES
jgi:hypothetical protein